MAKKCKLCGPYSRTQAQEFIEDIANTENYMVEHCTFSGNGCGSSLFNVMIIYDDGAGVPAKVMKRSVKK